VLAKWKSENFEMSMFTDDLIVRWGVFLYLYDPMNVWQCRNTKNRDNDGMYSDAMKKIPLLRSAIEN
jgi:hypothetical protein